MSALRPLAICCILLTAACTPSVRIARTQPADINVGTEATLVLARVDARPAERSHLAGLFVRMVAEHGWFTARDRSHENLAVQVGGGVLSHPVGAEPSAGEATVLLSVQEWDVATQFDIEHEIVEIGEDGQAHRRFGLCVVRYAQAVVDATVADAQGRVLAQRRYHGEAYGDTPGLGIGGSFRHPRTHATIHLHTGANGVLLEQAMRAAIGGLLADMTPVTVQERIVLCDEDERQEELVKLARRAELAAAEMGFRSFVTREPQNAIALFNLAAVIDAQGRYEEALDWYEQATTLRPQAEWLRARTACQRRLADMQALQR